MSEKKLRPTKIFARQKSRRDAGATKGNGGTSAAKAAGIFGGFMSELKLRPPEKQTARCRAEAPPAARQAGAPRKLALRKKWRKTKEPARRRRYERQRRSFSG